MKTELFSISKIFTERILRIPDYQRGYAWTEKELKDFWNDLVQLEDGKNHYVGVLTLEGVSQQEYQNWQDDNWIIESKNFEPYYIVDGQQRLTTTIILIQAITERIDSKVKLNFTTRNEIKKKFIFDSKDDGISRSYLFGYDKDNPSYEFLKTRIFQEKSDSSLPIQSTIYTYNLEFAKQFFLDNLKTLSFEHIEQLYRKLTQYFLFNIYSISDDIDVFVAFETMNNRGRPLSHLEILKNRLIWLSTKFKVEDYEKQKLRASINEGWKSIYHYLGRNKERRLHDDVFLGSHFWLYFGDLNPSRTFLRREIPYGLVIRNYFSLIGDYLLEEEFAAKNIRLVNPDIEEQKELTVEKIYSYVQSLKDSVEIWYNILNPKDSNYSDAQKFWLEKLNRFPREAIIPIAPFIMIFFQSETDNPQRVRLLQSLERFLFMKTMDRFPFSHDFDHNDLKKLFSQFKKKEITGEKLIKEIEEKIDSIVQDKDVVQEISLNLRNEGFYRWAGVKYFFYEYELECKKRSKTSREKLNWEKFAENDLPDEEDKQDFISIEHIYPKSARKTCWTSKFNLFNDKQKRLLRNSLGNLVPLSEPKNNALENDCFEEKKGRPGSLVGYKFGSYSEMEIAEYEDWTAKEIYARGLKLLDFWEKRWKFNFGDRNDKARFLQIDFPH